MKTILMGSVAALTLTAGVATAADLPSRQPAFPPQPIYAPTPAFTWTGLYVGVNGGYGFGSLTKDGKDVFGSSAKGGMFGGTVGYNYQFGQIVAGVEADLDWTNIGQSRTLTNPPFAIDGSSKADLRAFGTVRGRVGYAIDRTLLYVTGGYAGGSLRASLTDTTNALAFSQSKFLNGYALGAGVEYAFTKNITAKAEYLYTSLGSKDYFAAPDVTRSGMQFSTVRLGLNYKF